MVSFLCENCKRTVLCAGFAVCKTLSFGDSSFKGFSGNGSSVSLLTEHIIKSTYPDAEHRGIKPDARIN